MPIEQMIPKIFAHVDLDKWGTRRPELVTLVAQLQAGSANPAPLGRQLLQAMGRTRRQARHDHDTLIELAERYRVLTRWRGLGTRPDCWSIADVARWRRIPWIGTRADVVRSFSSPLPGAAVALWAKTPGQPWRSDPFSPEFGSESDPGLRSDHRATTPRQRATTPQPPAQTGPSPGHNATQAAGVSQLPLTSKEVVNKDLEEEEGWIDREAERLGRVVAKRIGRERLWQAARRPVEAAIRRYPEHLDKLYRVAVTVPGEILNPVEAAKTFEALADATAADGWPAPAPDPRIKNLLRLIATLEHEAPNDDRLPDLRAELASLQIGS